MKRSKLGMLLLSSATWMFFTVQIIQAQYVDLSSVSDSGFRSFLVKWEQGITRFINSDPSAWKQNCSHSDDATIFGGFGGYGEKTWQVVGPRYDWASSQYKPSGATVKVDYLSIIVGTDLAYTVSIEQSEARLGDAEKTTPRILRATQIFRKENGEWKLIHRHADPMTEKKAPGTDD